MTAADLEPLVDDLLRARRHWPERTAGLTRDDARDIARRARAYVCQAQPADDRTDDGPAPRGLVLVTKSPHAATPEVVTAIVARCLGYGLGIRSLRELPDRMRSRLPTALYPGSFQFSRRCDLDDQGMTLIRGHFHTDAYLTVMGERYSDSHVTFPDELIAEGHGRAFLRALWEEGRSPVSFPLVAERYGTRAARILCTDQADLPWFHCAWPIGIQRLRPGLVVFAFRRPDVRGGRPVLLVNGYSLALEELFAGRTWLADVEPASDVPVATVRAELLGHSNSPEQCLPGTVRRDALDGQLAYCDPGGITSRANVIHLSDGWLAAAIEWTRLTGRPPVDAPAVSALRAEGLTDDELDRLVLSDPWIAGGPAPRTATQLTRGLSQVEAREVLSRLFPPVFGEAPSRGHGWTLADFDSRARALAGAGFDTRRFSEGSNPITPWTPRAGSRRSTPPPTTSGPRTTAESGRRAIAESAVAMIAPAGGTAGRFGGYGVPEDSPSRQKAFLSLFQVHGRRCSALDLRLANARHWRRRLSCRLPLAVVTSDSGAEALATWLETLPEDDRSSVVTLTQHGLYRLQTPAQNPADFAQRWRWPDHIVRSSDGTPSLKPPGHMGVLTTLVLQGVLTAWLNAGVRYAVIASGDDVGFRLEPELLGELEQDPSCDGILRVRRQTFRADGPDGALAVPARLDKDEAVDSRGHRHDVSIQGDGTARIAAGSLVTCVDIRAEKAGLVALDARQRVVVKDAPSHRIRPDPEHYINCNQLYLRLTSLAALIGLGQGTDDQGTDRAPDMSAFLRGYPVIAEEKEVALDGVTVVATQFEQGLNELLGYLATVDVRPYQGILPAPGTRSSYAALKRPEDVAFAQAMIDRLGSAELALH